MALLLNIDTSVTGASACISLDGSLLDAVSLNGKENGLHEPIASMFANVSRKLQEIDAVVVTIGPGSYTGLRVGLATAKGICFAINRPLITVGTLELMAFAMLDKVTGYVCPMIDARRMEVFTAIYDNKMTVIMPPQAMIITDNSFNDYLEKHSIIFAGNGSTKLKGLLDHPNAQFISAEFSALDMPVLAEQYFRQQRFADLAYSEPLYLKEFYLPERQS